MHHETYNSPGLWFVAPYKGLAGEESDRPWVGPMIYDGHGELVWSGGAMFNSNVEDFRISNVNGEQLMTLMTHHEAFVLDDDYTVRSAISLANGGFINTHELNFVDNGTRAIFLEFGPRRASREESQRIGFDGECNVQFDGFAVLDVTKDDDWPHVFRWSSFGKIGLEEGTWTSGSTEHRCRGWDMIHANSVDKTPEGDYLFSARHTDTVYKISGKDGAIIWRLGGVKSSFQISDELTFSRQHDVRYRGQNDTHLWLSILDNSRGQDRDEQLPTHDFSRGLLFAIDEKNMQATLEKHYDHPYRHKGDAWAPRRGNYQLLPNGNVFMGWSERAIQSEHTLNGQLIWEATLQVDWMGSYRNYKFNGFVGKPQDPPTAVARARDKNGTASTTVHVSWNGATEVSTWNLYRTSPDGQTTRVLVDTSPRAGFETTLAYTGYANTIVVDAVDRRGKVIGQTPAVKIVADASVSAQALVEEERWLQELEEARTRVSAMPMTAAVIGFLTGSLFGVSVLVILWHLRQQVPGLFRQIYRSRSRYTPIPQQSDSAAVPLDVIRGDGVENEGEEASKHV